MTEEVEIIQRHIDQLAEHYDSVQIFCTRHDPDKGTFNISRGNGNWFARLGHIAEWITTANEQIKEGVRKENPDES